MWTEDSRRGPGELAAAVPVARREGACGSRSTGGCRPRTGRTPPRRWPGSGSRPGPWCAGTGRSWPSSSILEKAARWPGPAGRRRQPSLVAHLADLGRGWDAIVIGEHERAFYGAQYALMAPLFEHYGDPALASGGRRASRLLLRARRAGHDCARPVVQARGSPDQYPGADRDGRPDAGPGPLPRRPASLRIPAGRRRAAPEQGARRLGAPGAPAGA